MHILLIVGFWGGAMHVLVGFGWRDARTVVVGFGWRGAGTSRFGRRDERIGRLGRARGEQETRVKN